MKCIITVKMDVTRWMPKGWQKFDDQKIIEWVGDAPEIIDECYTEDGLYSDFDNGDPYIVKKVERVE